MADPTIENPTNEDGTWETPDGGKTWLLVTPSQAFIDAQAATPDLIETPDPLTEVQALLDALLGEDE